MFVFAIAVASVSIGIVTEMGRRRQFPDDPKWKVVDALRAKGHTVSGKFIQRFSAERLNELYKGVKPGQIPVIPPPQKKVKPEKVTIRKLVKKKNKRQLSLVREKIRKKVPKPFTINEFMARIPKGISPCERLRQYQEEYCDHTYVEIACHATSEKSIVSCRICGKVS
jgi:hypothetical protein